MKKQRLKAVALTTVLSAGALMGSAVQADETLEQILQVGQAKTTLAQESQRRIERLAAETNNLLQEFQTVNKTIQDLRVFNSQLERRIANQLVMIDELEEAIANVSVVERLMPPLTMRMLDSLEQFIELDKPFRREERLNRVRTLQGNLTRPDISEAEKFRQVLEAYRIEAQYGRYLDAYRDTLHINGQDREVNILQVGRTTLIYQTTDAQFAGAWDSAQNDWVALDRSYRDSIQVALRIARQQATQDIMMLPVQAPEAAR